eukprot:scaffold50946_cov66-Attheya_sp.AAC.2
MPAIRRAGLTETGERELNENNIINIIDGDIEREDPFMRYTNQYGVDLIFDYQMEKAGLYLRYSSYVYGSNRPHRNVSSECYVKRQKLLCLPPLDEAEAAAHHQVEVEIDSEFLHNNELYRMSELGAFRIHAICIIPPTDALHQFGEEYVRTQVQARLGLV